ncbi:MULTISPECIES: hypothetical protein [Arthrobacter]|uniref:hypothetical protein n=1 Tax=unclassified Arthrobacter TaxID=235627 RepID=UPI0024BB34AA|nr:hypothetical protein [Arthrobacter sp. H35-MC1]MDJ0317957.1 hypothetical protein [Arthrobacter sp. H35-MC1]
MSTGTRGADLEAHRQHQPNMRAGYTNISANTMHQLVAAIAADALNVPARDISAKIHDEQGQVSVSLAVPLVLRAQGQDFYLDSPSDDVRMNLESDGGTVFERAAAVRDVVRKRLHALAGTTVGRVDIRFTGIHDGKPITTGRVQ